MPKLLDVAEGWTGELGPFTLRADGQPVALPESVELVLVGRSGTGTAVNTTGKVRIADDQSGAERGQVYYTPGASDLRNSETPYSVRWKVTDESGRVVFFPNGRSDTFAVFKP